MVLQFRHNGDIGYIDYPRARDVGFWGALWMNIKFTFYDYKNWPFHLYILAKVVALIAYYGNDVKFLKEGRLHRFLLKQKKI